MPTAVVVLPSTTYRAGDFLSAAQGLGIDLVVASEQPPPFDMGEGYLQIDCSNPEQAAEQIVAIGDRAPIDGVVAADDAGVVVAALAGQKLGLRSNEVEAAAATRDKSVQRRKLASAEVPQAGFVVLAPEDDPMAAATEVGYPLVVKPIDRSAGQGVIRVDAPDDLEAAVSRLRDIVGEEAPVLIEEYMPGAEVAVEGLLRDGELTVLAYFDKPDASQGPYFPETILVTPSRMGGEVLTECERVATAALRGLGISHGPVHIELKVEGGQVRVIEVAARSIGGLCSNSLNFGLTGTSLETLILRNAVGLDKPELRREKSASGVLMIPIPRTGVFKGIRNESEMRDIEGVTTIDVTASPGSRLEPPPEGDRYLGFVFARGPRPEEVESILRKAAEIVDLDLE